MQCIAPAISVLKDPSALWEERAQRVVVVLVLLLLLFECRLVNEELYCQLLLQALVGCELHDRLPCTRMRACSCMRRTNQAPENIRDFYLP